MGKVCPGGLKPHNGTNALKSLGSSGSTVKRPSEDDDPSSLVPQVGKMKITTTTIIRTGINTNILIFIF